MNDLPHNGNYPPGMKESDITGWDDYWDDDWDDDECNKDSYGLYDDNEREYYREDYEDDL